MQEAMRMKPNRGRATVTSEWTLCASTGWMRRTKPTGREGEEGRAGERSLLVGSLSFRFSEAGTRRRWRNWRPRPHGQAGYGRLAAGLASGHRDAGTGS